VLTHPYLITAIAEQRQIARRARASRSRLVRFGRSRADRQEPVSSRLADVVPLSSPSDPAAADAARVA
jgi:hypothetical protein